VGGRHGPHPISTGDELLEFVIDELKGLRIDLAKHFAPADPEPSAPDINEQSKPAPVAVPIREPATSTDSRPVKVAEPAKSTAVRKAPAKRAASKEN
jgi:hypothetical protein